MEGKTNQFLMKAKLLILFLFTWSASFGQVPNTATFTIGQVMVAVYGDSTVGRNTATVFADSNADLFDATYGSKTMSPQTINGFRNYGSCTRPGGLTTSYFYSKVNGVSITDGASAIYYRDNFSCVSSCTSVQGETAGSDGDPVYSNPGISMDCTKIPDHYYVMATYISGIWHYTAMYVSGGLYYSIPE